MDNTLEDLQVGAWVVYNNTIFKIGVLDDKFARVDERGGYYHRDNLTLWKPDVGELMVRASTVDEEEQLSLINYVPSDWEKDTGRYAQDRHYPMEHIYTLDNYRKPNECEQTHLFTLPKH